MPGHTEILCQMISMHLTYLIYIHRAVVYSFAGFVPLLLSGFRGDTYTIRDLIDAGADSSVQARAA